jgi:NAD(P)-dependent dehydrogenase (short-subunit alcohol dehydrogenase family)
VAILARGAERVQAACEELDRLGVTSLGICADVADADAVERAAQQIEAQLGPIEVWVNNAMVTVFAPLHEVTPEEFRRVTDVTYLGAVHGTLAALKRMRTRDRGCIVQVGSALAYRSIPLQSAYCGAKAAVRGFTDALRCELIHDGSHVRLTMVQLSAFNTPQFEWGRSRMPRRVQPVPPIFDPQIAAEAIVWAASHPRREYWVGWPAVEAILSSRVLPAAGDRLAARRAYEGQQGEEPAGEAQPDNLFAPAPGAFAARGRFTARSRARSLQPWLARRRHWIAATLGLLLLVALGGILLD